MSDPILNREDAPIVGPTDREWALILAGGLAWAVGKIEGMGGDPGYAGRLLERWERPMVYVDGVLQPPMPERDL